MAFRVLAVLGDSIANGYWDEGGLGWFGRLGHKIAKKYPYKFGFNNQAQSGDRSIDVFHRLHTEIFSREVDILLISVGVNDLIRWGSTETQTDMSEGMQFEFWQNILLAATKNIEHVIVVGVSPVNEAVMPAIGAMKREFWYQNKDIEAYNERLAKWCGDFSVPFIDMYPVVREHGVASCLYDTVHPNAKGHELICDHVFAELDRLGIFEENK